MPNRYLPYPMVLNGVFLGILGLREDQIDHFNIPPASAAELQEMAYLGTIKEHKRNIFSERLDQEAPSRTKTISRKTNVERTRKKLTNSRGGTPVIVPTDRKSTPATPLSTAQGTPPRTAQTRTTTIKFPSNVTNSQISRWLNTKLTNNKPTYFKTKSGVNYPISPGPAGARDTEETTTP